MSRRAKSDPFVRKSTLLAANARHDAQRHVVSFDPGARYNALNLDRLFAIRKHKP